MPNRLIQPRFSKTIFQKPSFFINITPPIYKKGATGLQMNPSSLSQ